MTSPILSVRGARESELSVRELSILVGEFVDVLSRKSVESAVQARLLQQSQGTLKSAPKVQNKCYRARSPLPKDSDLLQVAVDPPLTNCSSRKNPDITWSEATFRGPINHLKEFSLDDENGFVFRVRP
jgi:hypothetical protein